MIPGLEKLFAYKPDYEQFVAPLHVAEPHQPDLSRFKKGIDNIHIDVCLSQEFKARTQILVRKILLHHVAENYWGEPPPPPDTKDLQAMKDSYAGMMEMAVAFANQEGQPERIQLLQLSALKYFLQLIDLEIGRLRDQLRGVKGQESHDSTGRSVEAHERLVILAKNESSIRYKLSRKLFREVLWVERTRGTKLRKSVFGASWQLPKQLLFNPILQIPSLWADEQVMSHYSLACTSKDNQDIFVQINRIVVDLFGDYLPGWCQPLEAGTEKRTSIEVREQDSTTVFTEGGDHNGTLSYNQIRRMLSSALQEEEYQKGMMSWLDSPQNLDRIIYSIRPKRSCQFEGSENIHASSWVDGNWSRYYHKLLKRIYKKFTENRHDQEILACQAAPKVYRDLRQQVPVRMICQYLSGRLRKKDLQRRLGSSSVTVPQQHIFKVLDQAVSDINTMPRERRRKHLLVFLHQFAHFRRDLKLAFRTYQALNRIRILEKNEDIDLSRNNGTLYEFVLRGELQPKQQQIRNHVILKADVRGSTEMTYQLKQKGLNPATHFSINFFEPINKLLGVYGARKVFVEGDAVILSIYEYENAPFQWLCVAHACGLARDILHVVDVQNVQNRKYGLPDLELGLGIAFSDQSPSFLYDGEKEITISPAINRADQLSSCSAMIKRSGYPAKRGRGVDLFYQGQGLIQNKETSDQLVRYNVNGIELDVSAFYKLKTEVSLRRVDIDGAAYSAEGSKFYAARYPDLGGRMHWLVIREGPVMEWSEGAPAAQDQGRRFYEVVTNEDLIKDVKVRVGNRSKQGARDEVGETSEHPTSSRYFH